MFRSMSNLLLSVLRLHLASIWQSRVLLEWQMLGT